MLLKNLVKRVVSTLGYQIIKNDNLTQLINELKKNIEVQEKIDRGDFLWPFQSLPPTLRAKQLAFLHIGKTAGSSVTKLLFKTFASLPTYHSDIVSFDRVSRKELKKYGFIIGHFSYCHTAKFLHDHYLFTFLRNPVERVLSNYYFLRSSETTNSSNHEMVTAAKSMSLIQFLHSNIPQVQSVMRNHQTYALGDDWRYRVSKAKEEYIFDRAMANLHKLSFVGITERYNESIRYLFNDLGLKHPAALEKVNITANKPRTEKHSSADIDYINEINALDWKIYQEAVKIFETKYNLRFKDQSLCKLS